MALDPDTACWDSLTEGFPESRALLMEHRRDHDETLPHLFMADVARWFVQKHLAGATDATSALGDRLDETYAGASEYVRNVIDVSFLEMLPWPPDPDAIGAANDLGPRLRQALKEMQAWRPAS